MNGGPFKPRRRRMGIHFRLGPDEPGFIIGGFIADCYTGGKGAYSGIIFAEEKARKRTF